MANHPDPESRELRHPVDRIQSLELRNISFGYGDRPGDALKGVSMTIRRGERVGVIGPVGSGKTTLIKAMMGLLPPRSGEILVNGQDLRNSDGDAYRSLLGYVPQEALLFSGTLRENIDFGSDDHSDENFRMAVQTAQLASEIAAFAEKEQTRVGQRGISLSGGQKQRMAIARALARKPEMLLFDDITASLDATNEERLMHRLDELSADISCVIVSHRLSTLQYVDKVLFLKDGRTLAFGTHDQLLGNPEYREFINELTGDN
jgi:ATP-binding cassette subfamily B protein